MAVDAARDGDAARHAAMRRRGEATTRSEARADWGFLFLEKMGISGGASERS
jgi:hypothetical protein